jgi:hypothetical protein
MISDGRINGAKAGYETYSTGPDLGITAQTALAMAATGQTARLPAILNYLENNVSAYIDVRSSGGEPAYTDAGHVALLLLVAHATGTGSKFHASSLLTTLLSLQQTSGSTAGLFGLNDATYDGVFRTALALQALAERGETTAVPAVAGGLSWMLAQQCPSGGFTTIRSEDPCSGLPTSYQGPDTNTTAQALLALTALHQPTGAGTPTARAVAWLASLESKRATWAYYPGSEPDSNSTAIVSVGLRAVGQQLAGSPWAKPGGLWPLRSLLTYEDTTPGANLGGYVFQPGDLPDSLSTAQVTLALSGAPVPI